MTLLFLVPPPLSQLLVRRLHRSGLPVPVTPIFELPSSQNDAPVVASNLRGPLEMHPVGSTIPMWRESFKLAVLHQRNNMSIVLVELGALERVGMSTFTYSPLLEIWAQTPRDAVTSTVSKIASGMNGHIVGRQGRARVQQVTNLFNSGICPSVLP